MKKLIIVCAAVLLILIVIPEQSLESRRYKVSFLDYFDTYSELTIYAASETEATQIARIARDELRTCNQLYDIYNSYDGINNLKTVNDSAGIAPVAVDSRIINLLIFGKEIYKQTDGRVNIAMGSVLSLWHDQRTVGIADPENAAIPDMDVLLDAAQHTDINQLIIDEDDQTVYLADPEMSLDVGAIGKGFATELAARLMVTYGAESALLSVGGNVRAIGIRGDGRPWQVGVQNPDLSQEQSDIATVSLDGDSMVTSGDYQRYYFVDGIRYHHIIDPDTLMPAAYVRSVTIQTEQSGIADALSTALFTVSIEQGEEILSQFANVEALWVDLNNEIFQTEGFLDKSVQ